MSKAKWMIAAVVLVVGLASVPVVQHVRAEREHQRLLRDYYTIAPNGLSELKRSREQSQRIWNDTVAAGVVPVGDGGASYDEQIRKAEAIRRQIHELGRQAPND